jgi:2-phospho-L-lactate guanylyltransferase (CobY/MobA/RfbA family)
MLEDVLAACVVVGRTLLVAPVDDASARERAAALEIELVPDPGGGQGAAVAAGLARVEGGPALVVNADLPCATPRDLLALHGSAAPGGMALAAAADGTTNALALSEPALYTALYGPSSAGRFRAHASKLGVPFAVAEIPNLADDADTLEDLERLESRLGPATKAACESLRAGIPR